jgi:hypothetical protein
VLAAVGPCSQPDRVSLPAFPATAPLARDVQEMP